MPSSDALTLEQALAELDVLATLEHALVVEYLSVSYALLPPPDAPAETFGPAEAALALARSEMRHFHHANRTLTQAGKPAQVGRAASIDHAGSSIALGTPSAAELVHLVDREQVIASALDSRYARVCPLFADDPFFDCPDHRGALADLESKLPGADASAFLHTTVREPADGPQRALLAVSNQYYRALVAALGGAFGDETQLGDLLGVAMQTMDQLDAINRLLVGRGVLPSFTL